MNFDLASHLKNEKRYYLFRLKIEKCKIYG